MVFLSLLFISLYLAAMIKGSLFYNTTKLGIELQIKQLEGAISDSEYTKQGARLLFPYLFAILWVVLTIAFYIYALDIEQLKILTLVMLGYTIVTFVKNFAKKKPANTEEAKLEHLKKQLYTLKNRTFTGTVINAFHLFYFCLAFYTLVFK
ncbi:hypothetical protein [Brevibacillus sp. NRS-1366]|uniref:hypothetical protein n=1 Tax=Brevibacillus sp. NRS-1366 TaxID=3233899 RepID=UPI003D1DA711